MKRYSRRDVLKLSGGLAVFAACSRAERRPTVPTPKPNFSLVLVSAEIAVGDRRLPFALFKGSDPLAVDEIAAQLVSPNGGTVDLEVVPENTSFGRGGDDDSARATVIYVGDHKFMESGFWTISASFESDGSPKDVQASFEVIAESVSVGVGQAALMSVTPTVSDPRGIDPICTRTPPCGLHTKSVSEVVGAGKPSVIVFATPEFCTSRTCGPIVDIVESVAKKTSDVDFIHLEIFKAGPQSERLPAVAEWAIPTEPWIVFVDAKGNVAARWSGAAGADEIARAVERLKSSTLA